MLSHKSEASSLIAWQILEVTANVPNSEIQVALLGVNPSSVKSIAIATYVTQC